MLRFIILMGYAFLMLMLETTGKIDQYINSHYQYLSTISLVLALFLGLCQLLFWAREEPGQAAQSYVHDCADDHRHLQKPLQRFSAYLLLALPLIVGFLFPTVSLDTTIVEAKGFHFPVNQEAVGDPDFQVQYLKPDTSLYFNAEDYSQQMRQLLADYQQRQVIDITDENYLEVMELIYNYPSEFIGKTVSYTGFVFHQQTQDTSQIFIFRFGIIHCVADAGVFGLLAELPTGTSAENDDWLTVTGTIGNQYYEPFRRMIPTVAVTEATAITPPENQYVYRTF